MEWDIGFVGLGLLLAMSLGFGILAQLFAGQGITRWMWLIGTAVFFGFGLLISEAWFGTATEEELQPIVDGLSRDEVLLAIFPGIAAVWITRYVVKHRRAQPRGYIAIPHG